MELCPDLGLRLAAWLVLCLIKVRIEFCGFHRLFCCVMTQSTSSGGNGNQKELTSAPLHLPFVAGGDVYEKK